jgi:ABC-type Mn2+/Zn2+ transport system permease subunit
MSYQLKTLVELFPWAIISGVLIAATCAVMGVFVILRRVVFIGITLSEVAACGIAAALLIGWPPLIGAAAITLLAVLLLAQPFELERVPRDALLGVIFVAASAGSILLVSQGGFELHEVKMLLYGDLILTSKRDCAAAAATLLPVLLLLLLFVRPLLYAFMDRDAARVMGIHVRFWEIAFFAALGLAVSAASKIAGALLVFAYLVVAPAAALLLIRRLGWALTAAAGIAVTATLSGLCWSFSGDLPTNQSISLIICILFALVLILHVARRTVQRGKRGEQQIALNSRPAS